MKPNVPTTMLLYSITQPASEEELSRLLIAPLLEWWNIEVAALVVTLSTPLGEKVELTLEPLKSIPPNTLQAMSLRSSRPELTLALMAASLSSAICQDVPESEPDLLRKLHLRS